ncbi:TRC40/GET3/ArsA family transport-energizing ATPase [uncultured Anaerococcus sp.]|uniref:ArsA family ATPase n=1 Tax=uncultured Anaerococcus sp. TaxID=293428 RepID=UPI00280AB1E3|nr:TRC40/GET3/ArsA family transport-energizing ATPase [uncultured Anaerococcus sp.]
MAKKIFMYTGKGGVGKSTLASSTALLSAKKNIETILISIDSAHSLSDIFSIKIGSNLTKVREGLTAIEFDSSKILEEEFPSIKASLANEFRKVDFSKISYNSSYDLPFVVNILSLLKILDIYENYDFENIIVDCPASASTFAYLKIPEMLTWYLEKFFGVGKGIIRTLRPISKYKYQINLPDKEALDKLEITYQRLKKLENLLKDKSISTIRLVGLAEKMVIEESKRDFAYLSLFDYNVDGYFVNRLFTDEDVDFIKKRIQIQDKRLEEIEACFYNLPIYKLGLRSKDLKSLADLEDFAESLVFKDSLLEIKAFEEGYYYEKMANGYILTMYIGEVDDVEVYKKGSDINIRLKDIKRIISLPNVCVNSVISKYFIQDDKLLIYLENKGQEEFSV